MGGEGSMMAANQSLKNNRSQLKRKENKALGGSYANIKLKKFPEATEAQLQDIKNRVQSENKQIRIKQFVVLGVCIITLVIFFILL